MSFTRNGRQYVAAKIMMGQWKCSCGSLYTWLRKGEIEGAVKYNGHWYIPTDAECPNKYKLRSTHRHVSHSEDYEEWYRRMGYYNDNYQKNFMEV